MRTNEAAKTLEERQAELETEKYNELEKMCEETQSPSIVGRITQGLRKLKDKLAHQEATNENDEFEDIFSFSS